MRLLYVHDFTLHEFHASGAAPPYAILSHTWGEEEVEFLDLHGLGLKDREEKKGWQKIEYTCLQAKEHGLDYAWVDTCCRYSREDGAKPRHCAYLS